MLTTIENIRGNIASSASKLDSDVPGWWLKINLEILNLNSTQLCIAGQLGLTGRNPDINVQWIPRIDGDTIAWSYLRGFYIPNGIRVEGYRLDDAENKMEEFWREEINNRRELVNMSSIEMV